MDTNPLKKRTKVLDPKDEFKKPKPAFSKGVAKTMLEIQSDPDIPWLEYEIEDLCRSRCLPLQLKSNDFMRLLSQLFETQEALKILNDLRIKYRSTHPITHKITEDDFAFLKLEDDRD